MKEQRSKILDAGCKVLYERIAEAYEPEWRELLARIYEAMRNAPAPSAGEEKTGG